MNEAREWSLRNAVEAERESPYTFYRPSEAVLGMVGPGNLVKVIFDFEGEAPGGERMWLEVLSRNGDEFVGRLDNEPLSCPDLKADDSVHFSSWHIIDTDLPDAKSAAMKRFFARCLVSNLVLRESKPVGWLFREEPAKENDSGWRLFAGSESDDDTNDPKNASYVAMGVLLNRDDSFLSLLESPPGSAFERASGGEFIQVGE